MDIVPYLKLMAEKGASDLFFSTAAPVNIKIEGSSAPLSDKPLPPGMVKVLPEMVRVKAISSVSSYIAAPGFAGA